MHQGLIEPLQMGIGGEKLPVTVGPEAVNFDQVEVGDTVRITLAQTLSIYMGDADSVASGECGPRRTTGHRNRGPRRGPSLA